MPEQLCIMLIFTRFKILEIIAKFMYTDFFFSFLVHISLSVQNTAEN